MKKRILSLALAMLLIFGTVLLSACGDKKTDETEQNTGNQTTAPTDGTDPLEYYKTQFGDVNLDGKEIWIYDLNTSPDVHVNFYDDIQGDPMNVALYKRDNLFVDLYGVSFEYFQNTAGSKLISNAVLAGSYVADIIYGRASGDRLMTLAQMDCMKDMRSLEKLDFSQAWWGNFITDSLTVNDRLFFTSGDILPTFYQSIGCFFYNIDLGNSYGISKDEVSKTTTEGNLTWEYITTASKDAYLNLDSNSDMTADKDQFGLITYNVYNHTNMFTIGAGLN
ncbi:MAG: hypothetical protein IKC59_02110, partial [Clostridia bacterium]|nr:hypothetical protein [Clostridia bacterium]